MTSDPAPPSKPAPDMARQIGAAASRKVRAQRRGHKDVWFGLGMMGIIGWSVSVPTLLGAALGHWLDSHYPARFGWTLALLMAGLTVGCLNAWHWVAREDREMHAGENDNDA